MSQRRTLNHIIIDSKEINDDMFERAALRHVKEFTPDSAHALFLQGMRSKGRVGTIVENPTTQEQIDTRTYGNSRVRHRENNNRLMSDSESGVASTPPPPLYPQGSEKKGKSTGDEEKTFFASFVTPQRNSRMVKDSNSSYPALMQSNVDIASVLDSSTTDSMLARVKTRAFKDTGVMTVLNIDLGVDIHSPPRPNLYLRPGGFF